MGAAARGIDDVAVGAASSEDTFGIAEQPAASSAIESGTETRRSVEIQRMAQVALKTVSATEWAKPANIAAPIPPRTHFFPADDAE